MFLLSIYLHICLNCPIHTAYHHTRAGPVHTGGGGGGEGGPARPRMTMGQMWESVLGKLNALVGAAGGFGRCGVAFTAVNRLEAGCAALHTAGFPRMGREQLYSGATGEPLDGRTFIGSVFYQRLRHMVADWGDIVKRLGYLGKKYMKSDDNQAFRGTVSKPVDK